MAIKNEKRTCNTKAGSRVPAARTVLAHRPVRSLQDLNLRFSRGALVACVWWQFRFINTDNTVRWQFRFKTDDRVNYWILIKARQPLIIKIKNHRIVIRLRLFLGFAIMFKSRYFMITLWLVVKVHTFNKKHPKTCPNSYEIYIYL